MDEVDVMAAYSDPLGVCVVLCLWSLYKAPWLWILCDAKHVGAILNIL